MCKNLESAGSILWEHTGSVYLYLLPTTPCKSSLPWINHFTFIKICGDSRWGCCELYQDIWSRGILKSEDLKSANSDPKSNEINMSNLKFQGTSISTPLTTAMHFLRSSAEKWRRQKWSTICLHARTSGDEAFSWQLELIRKHAPKVMVGKGLDLVDTSYYYVLISLGVIKRKIVSFCLTLTLWNHQKIFPQCFGC